MTYDDRVKIMFETKQMISDLLETAGFTGENILLLVRNLYQHGEKLVNVIEREKGITQHIECKSGCSYCCYAQVSLTPPEAFLISSYIRDNYSLKNMDLLMKRTSNNIRLTRDKSLEERIKVWGKTPCIFLEDTKCSIYDVRPFICRAWHSLSAEQCKNAFNSGDKESEIDSTPYRNIIYGAIREALMDTCVDAGCESETIAITDSIKTILNHPSPENAWINGELLFHD
jgi:Fe-S-cluster containining protein